VNVGATTTDHPERLAPYVTFAEKLAVFVPETLILDKLVLAAIPVIFTEPILEILIAPERLAAEIVKVLPEATVTFQPERLAPYVTSSANRTVFVPLNENPDKSVFAPISSIFIEPAPLIVLPDKKAAVPSIVAPEGTVTACDIVLALLTINL